MAEPWLKLNLIKSECQRNHPFAHIFCWICCHNSVLVVQLCRWLWVKEDKWYTHNMHDFPMISALQLMFLSNKWNSLAICVDTRIIKLPDGGEVFLLYSVLVMFASELWCLSEGKRGDYQNCSMLYCIRQMCTIISTLRWAVLWIGFCYTGCNSLCIA